MYNDPNFQAGQGQPQQPGQMPGQKPEKVKKGVPKIVKIICAAVVFGLVAGTVFQGVNYVGNRVFGTNTAAEPAKQSYASLQTTAVSTGTDSSGTAAEADVSKVAENCMPSIVAVNNMSVQEVQSFFGGTSEQEVQNAGSGIIIGQNDAELLMVTNYHVIAASKELTVTFIDEETVEAKLKGGDESKDIAVISVPLDSIKDSTMKQIKVATIGDSDALKVGQQVIAIGNALGYGQSVTSGIVSALNRSIEDVGLSGEYIQTDAAINPGNSGGALLNASGEVIGINSAKLSSNGMSGTPAVESMAYAIPISDVQSLINTLMNQETREQVAEDERGVLGVRVQTVDAATASSYNMPTGVYVAEVTDSSGAKDAGMEKGDIITAVNGIGVDSSEGLVESLSYYKAGETVKVTLQRAQKNGDYEECQLDVKLGKQ